MPQRDRQASSILCPSVTEIGPDAEVLGARTGSATEGICVRHLTEALPAPGELLAAVDRPSSKR